MAFLPTAAAALEAGFRPCKRCRPETAPGTPAWAGTGSTVRRALRLIESGVDDVASLARRLHVSPRHLHRLFMEHVGAPPKRVVATGRLFLARALLDAGDAPISQVAFAAGFKSVRRFNDAYLRAFASTPSSVRGRRRDGARFDAALRLCVPVRAPYDFAATLAFLQTRAVAPLERIEDGCYLRAIEGGALRVSMNPDGRALVIDAPAAAATDLSVMIARVRRMFDVDADPHSIASVLQCDRALARVVRAHPGLRIVGTFDPFEACVRAVVGQQVSVAAATTIVGRIVARFGRGAFPTPHALARADLDGLGLPGARARTLKAMAVAVRDGALDEDDPTRGLAGIPGVGPWTIDYVRLRGYGDPDALPAGDLVLRRALGVKSARDVERRAEAWRPFRAYGAIALWRAATPAGANPPGRAPPRGRRPARLPQRPSSATPRSN